MRSMLVLGGLCGGFGKLFEIDEDRHVMGFDRDILLERGSEHRNAG